MVSLSFFKYICLPVKCSALYFSKLSACRISSETCLSSFGTENRGDMDPTVARALSMSSP